MRDGVASVIAEWVERLHDQARKEMGYCVPAKDAQWCSQHDSYKPIGQEACALMRTGYAVAEEAGEVMVEIITEAVNALRYPEAVFASEVLADVRNALKGQEQSRD